MCHAGAAHATGLAAIISENELGEVREHRLRPLDCSPQQGAGLTDQIGGPRKIAFGKRRACEAILAHRDESAIAIGEKLKQALAQWQGVQTRRDDVTLFCARIQEH